MPTTNEIIEAAGLSLSDLPGAHLDFAINKITNDTEVLNIAARLAADAFIVSALRKMNAGQLARLRKRIQPGPAPTVQWNVTLAQISQRPLLMAKYRTEEIFFDGEPERAAKLEFHGEHPPVHILQKYAAAYDPTNKPQMDAAYWHVRTAKAPRPSFTPGVE
jgi:hypothetical protein